MSATGEGEGGNTRTMSSFIVCIVICLIIYSNSNSTEACFFIIKCYLIHRSDITAGDWTDLVHNGATVDWKLTDVVLYMLADDRAALKRCIIVLYRRQGALCLVPPRSESLMYRSSLQEHAPGILNRLFNLAQE